MQKLRLFLFIVLLGLIAQTHSVFADVTVQKTTPGGGKEVTITDPNGGTYSAYLYLPSDYSTTTQTYPLLVFLHGSGEAGSNLSLIYDNSVAGGPAYLAEHGQFPSLVANPSNGQQYKFIILAPQATWFSTTGANLNNLLKGFIPAYRVDTNRLYITGLSAGGQGIVEYMVHQGWTNQYTAAAVVPMSEAWYYPAGSAQTIVNDKVYNWGFGSDPADQFGTLTKNLMNEINAISPGMARYTNYDGGHCCWNTFYDPNYKETINGTSMNIYGWLLQYSRGSSSTPSNQSPTANAGPDQTITLPTSSVTLTGSGTDSDGTVASYAWTKVSGSGGTITNASSASTTVTGLMQGSYVFQLTVTDNNGATGTDTVSITVNQAVSSGGSGAYNGPHTIPGTVQAEDFDTGGEGVGYHDTDASNYTGIYRPNDGIDLENTLDTGAGYDVGWIYTGEWMKYTISVPTTNSYTIGVRAAAPGSGSGVTIDIDGATVATVAISQTNSYQTWQTFSTSPISLTAGTHTMKLTSTSNGFNLNYYTFTADGSGTPSNIAPSANAGADKTITLPTSSVTLTGSGTDSDGTVASYAWSEQLGPNNATIASANSQTTTVSNLVQGSYIFRLTVTDNAGASATDDVGVVVNGLQNNPGTNIPPTVSAGALQTITLPTSSVTLTATASDTDGAVTSYEWSTSSGPTEPTFSSPASASTTVSNLVAGDYTFSVTVTDNNGAVATDDVEVVVNPQSSGGGGGGGSGGSSSGGSSGGGSTGGETTSGNDVPIPTQPITPLPSQKRVTVTASSLRVRATAGGTITTSVPLGTSGVDLGETFVAGVSWTNIRFDSGVIGWVATSYLQTEQDSSATPPPNTNTTRATVTAPVLNIRSAPAGTLVTTASRGMSGVVIATIGTWVQIRFDSGTQGWVSKTYVMLSGSSDGTPLTTQGCNPGARFSTVTGAPCTTTPISTQTITTTAINLNVRSAPAGSIIGTVPFGTTGTVITRSGTWVNVQFSTGLTGYVSASYTK